MDEEKVQPHLKGWDKLRRPDVSMRCEEVGICTELYISPFPF